MPKSSVEFCCFCIELKTGGKILGALGAIVSLVCMIYGISNLVKAVSAGVGVALSSLIVVASIIYLIVNILLLVTIFKKWTVMMGTWLVFQIILIISVALLAFIFLFKMSIYFVPTTIMLAATIYFCACIESLQKLLEAENEEATKTQPVESA